ncbi:MAG TPA: hypothetical protein PKZ36_00855 [Candidatus Paceibacterota bacterium]|nr:hypothetical protein [Candidatus Paceibacterota bacterium]HPT17947.1 hypothetical protein [Candidatus Paceibacterota bacterium]
MENKSKLNTILLIIIIILLVGGLSYFFFNNSRQEKNDNFINKIAEKKDNNNTNGEIMCTADSKQCPDGSYVGRTGINCEFICPEAKKVENKTVVIGEPFELSVGESVNFNQGDSVKFLKVVKGIPGTCGNDVQNCPDSVTLSFISNLTGETNEFSLGAFLPYKIGNVDIVFMNKINDNTYKFKISPTKF